MKNTVLYIIAICAIQLLINGAHAAEADRAIQCLDAGGYYGNVEINVTSSGHVQVYAAQGFAFDLSEQLGKLPGDEWGGISMVFDPQQCEISSHEIRCGGAVQLSLTDGSPLEMNAELSFDKSLEASSVTLVIRTFDGLNAGRATHRFASPLGSCMEKR